MLENRVPKKSLVAFGTFIAVFILILVLNPFVKIDAGERGVVMTWGAVQDRVLEEGIHWRIPIAQKVVKIDVKTQKVESNAVAYSKDLQTADAKIALNYHIIPGSANKLWQEIGKDYDERVIAPAIQEVMKQVASQYTAQELITQRVAVKEELKSGMTERLQRYYLFVDDISIVNFDFSEAFESAIEAKQIAEQSAAKAENDLKRIEIEAKQKIETAKADAESIRIQGEALANNPTLVSLKAVEKWNGELPKYMLGDSVPFLNIPQE